MRAHLQVTICFFASLLPWGAMASDPPKPTFEDLAVCVCTNGVQGWAAQGLDKLDLNSNMSAKRPDQDSGAWTGDSQYDDITIFHNPNFGQGAWKEIFVVCAHTKGYHPYNRPPDFHIIWGASIGNWDGETWRGKPGAVIYKDRIKRCGPPTPGEWTYTHS